MSSEQPNSIVLNIKVEDGDVFTKLWIALKERFIAARELTFGARSLTDMSKWRKLIPFAELQCESVVFMKTHEHFEVIASLVDDMKTMPRLESIRFHGFSFPFNVFLMSSLGKNLLASPSLLAKVKILRVFAESTDQVSLLQSIFSNLQAMSISLAPDNQQGSLLAVTFHTIQFRIPVESIGAIDMSLIETLHIHIQFGDIKSFLPAFGRKCPQLKDLCIVDQGDRDKTCKFINDQYLSWIIPLVLDSFPQLLKFIYYSMWFLGGPDRYLLNDKSFPAHPITCIEMNGWVNQIDLQKLLLACPSLSKVKIGDISFRSSDDDDLDVDDEYEFLDLCYSDDEDEFDMSWEDEDDEEEEEEEDDEEEEEGEGEEDDNEEGEEEEAVDLADVDMEEDEHDEEDEQVDDDEEGAISKVNNKSLECGSSAQDTVTSQDIAGRIKHFSVRNFTAYRSLDEFTSFVEKFLLKVTNFKITLDMLTRDNESEVSGLLAPAVEVILEKCVHLKNLTINNGFKTDLEVSLPAQCNLRKFGLDKLVIPKEQKVTWSDF